MWPVFKGDSAISGALRREHTVEGVASMRVNDADGKSRGFSIRHLRNFVFEILSIK
jgi:hypothetical protein